MTARCSVVTGGAGFIGSHLVDLLAARGDRVIVIDTFFLGKEENLRSARALAGDALVVHREDASDAGALRAILSREQPDVVYDLATKALLYSFRNPAGAARVNIEIALGLGELLREGVYGRLVHLSSSEVYGTAMHAPMDEWHPLLAETTYAAGKASADLILSSYARMFGVDARIVRPFNNYGPRQNDGDLAAIVPLTIGRILSGTAPVIEGDGQQTRDFTYVGDTVAAIAALADADFPAGVPVNLGSGEETSVATLVETICSLMGYRGTVRSEPARPADVRRHCADVRCAEVLIGPVAITPLEDGLKATIDWYRERW